MSHTYSRRHALWLSAGLLVACGDRGSGPDATAPAARSGAPPTGSGPAPGPTDGATPSCIETHANIEGPYYRAGAPERAVLTDGATPGTPIEIEGRVTGLDCGRGLANAELDVWHATHDGHYDNDGTMRTPGFLLRGRLRTDADGRYRIRTIAPGRYLNGSQYRPAHVHVKLRAASFAELTTQLYFPDDPYNAIDPFIHPSLVMAVTKSGSALKAHFDFTLRPT